MNLPRGQVRKAMAAALVAVPLAVLLTACTSSPADASVGDCIKGDDADSMSVVACTDPSAEWQVTQIVSNPNGSEDAIDQCTDQSATEAWEQFMNENLTDIVCLKPTSSDGSDN